MRTIRIAFIDGLFPIGFYIGNGLAGPIQKYFGAAYNFGFGMLFAMLAVIYTAFFLNDSRDEAEKKLANQYSSSISNGQPGKTRNLSARRKLKSQTARYLE